MNEALQAAVRLHDFLRANAGPSEEWPIQIISTEASALEYLDQLLTDFRRAYLEQ